MDRIEAVTAHGTPGVRHRRPSAIPSLRAL